ncbi:MAG: hypothetical protein WBA18_05390 [Terracidiphilus sp.]
MGSIINQLRIRTLQGQVEASRLYGKAIAGKFESAAAGAEKLKIARRYNESLKETYAMQLLLEMLEREERRAVEVAGMEASEAGAATCC